MTPSGSFKGAPYADVVRRVKGLTGVTCRQLGAVAAGPIYHLSLPGAVNRPRVLLLGGTHGDEPAGVETVLDFFAQGAKTWAAHFSFDAIPCLNPDGYSCGSRNNAYDCDLNWSYQQQELAEVQAVRQVIERQRFELVVDFHEDWESSGFYLYELDRQDRGVGRRVLAQVRGVAPLNMAAQIDGYEAEGGLIRPDPHLDEERRGRGIPLVLFAEHTDHLLVPETPTGQRMEMRVRAHRTALETALVALAARMVPQ